MKKYFLLLSTMCFLLSGILFADGTIFLTKKELAQFNGEKGAKAYIAVDGKIYDVTNVAAWKNGTHKGNKAGQDVTEKLKKAPHGNKVLEKLPQVGKMVEGFTVKELAKYNGEKGNKAYVAVDGLVYDVTEKWKNGMHKGNKAGQAISEKIKKAPHGKKVLENLAVVGKLEK